MIDQIKSRSVHISDLITAESSTILEVVLTSLDDDKAQDIVAIPLAGKSTIADHMVIASGASSRQLTSMADHLGRKLKECGFKAVGAEGGASGDWILIDAGDIIIHLFRPEVREFYQLEKMWVDQDFDETVTINMAGN